MTRHWTFEDSKLANNFGAHIKGQLPWYDLATGLVRCIAENYLPDNGVMYDIGASCGNITSSCDDLIKSRNVEAISIESSRAMCESWIGSGEIICDNAVNHEYKEFDLCVCFLTMMFLRPSDRVALMAKLKDKCLYGGAIVVVDKFNGNGGYIDTVMRRMTMRQKISSGESPKDIMDKELSLSGVQRPLQIQEIQGEQFFQIGEFRGFIITNNE